MSSRLGQAVSPWRGDAFWGVLAMMVAVLAGMVVAASPVAAVALLMLAVGLALWLVLGAESVAATISLAALGFVPFVDVETEIGPLRVWVVAFGISTLILLLAWWVRQASGKGRTRLEPSLLLVLALLFFTYTTVRLVLSDPLSEPTVTGALGAFPPAILIGYVVFSQEAARRNLRRLLPVLAGIFILWSLAYIAGSFGQCDACIDLVASDSEREGIAGSASRLYTAGAESVPVVAILSLGAALSGGPLLAIPVALIGIVDIALYAFRAQYVAFAAGALLLLGWRFRHARLNGRVILVFATLVALVAIFSTPAGDRGISGYQDLRDSSGNAGYRLRLISESSRDWSLFGLGVTDRAGAIGFNFDLGIPNTLLGLGYIGAALQLSVLVAAIVRALRFGGPLGVSLAAVVTLVLVGRPSLALIEYGPSDIAYGLIVGAICALPLSSTARDPSAARA